jgi:hypothetical protein
MILAKSIMLATIMLVAIPVLAQNTDGPYFLVVPPQFAGTAPYVPPTPPNAPDRSWVTAGDYPTLQECEAAKTTLKANAFDGEKHVVKSMPSDAACVPVSFYSPQSSAE